MTVSILLFYSTPKAMSCTEIEKATLADPTLQELFRIIKHNSWWLLKKANKRFDNSKLNIEELKQYAKVKDELTVSENESIILRGHRINHT